MSLLLGYLTKYGEKRLLPVLWVMTSRPKNLERLFQNSELAQFKRPRIYVFLEIIPRNATNKIIRRELKANVLRSRTKETNYKIVEV